MVTLHIPHFLVKLEVVTLKGTDVRSEICYDLILFSQFLRGRFPSELAAAGGELNECVSHLLELSVSLPKSISLAGHDGQDGCVCGV